VGLGLGAGELSHGVRPDAVPTVREREKERVCERESVCVCEGVGGWVGGWLGREVLNPLDESTKSNGRRQHA
jgi:hypothetical protein